MFIYMLSIFSVTTAASALAFFYSALVKIYAVANLCLALSYVLMMVRISVELISHSSYQCMHLQVHSLLWIFNSFMNMSLLSFISDIVGYFSTNVPSLSVDCCLSPLLCFCAVLKSDVSFSVLQVFSGLMINVSSIAEWLRWIKWLSIFRYGLNVRTNWSDWHIMLQFIAYLVNCSESN